MSQRVVVAMSGGVDSSTTAALLKEEGYNVIGVGMQIWDFSKTEEDIFGSCCSPRDVMDARKVAERLHIPFYLLNCEKEFEREVIDYFVSEYLMGRTPNPCILCNQKIKFDYLLRKAKEFDAEKISTGHYAFIERDKNGYVLKRGRDRKKDQSYFLFNLSQKQLSSIILPLGKYTKKEVRKLADKFGIGVAEKIESQEICFIPDNNYPEFIKKRLPHKMIHEGDIITKDGRVLGMHKGLPFYTIGQRRGLGIGYTKPLYVVDIDLKKNLLIVGESGDLFRKKLVAKDVNWNIPIKEREEIEAEVQIRYRHRPAKAKITSRKGGLADVSFLTAQRAVTPGQAAVFYKRDVVIGGGWII